jgi:hypothetical protein
MLDPATFRRTIFAFNVRSVPNPFLECLDSADPNATTPVRSSTVTPLQALALLNDPLVIELSHRFACRLQQHCSGEAEQIRRAVLETLGRPPTDEERKLLARFVRQEGLPRLCRYLMNTNEFLFVD